MTIQPAKLHSKNEQKFCITLLKASFHINISSFFMTIGSLYTISGVAIYVYITTPNQHILVRNIVVISKMT